MSAFSPIRFWIEETSGIDRAAEPVVGGMPLPRGAIHARGWFTVLDETGGSALWEGVPAAYWPDGSVKWLHLCGTVNLAGGRRNDLLLAPTPMEPASGLQAARDHGSVTITGGALTVQVMANPDRVLDVRDGTDSLLHGPGLTAILRLTEPGGPARPAVAWTFDPAQVQVVTLSSNRAVLRLPGRFVEGDRLVAELVVFIEVLRESRRIGIEPVFIYLGDPDHDLVTELTLTAHGTFHGEGARYGFANDRGPGYWDVVLPYEGGPCWPQARQVQLGSTFYRTEKRTCDAASWTKAREGQRATGWCHLGTDQGGLTAGMRYFWQEYPRALSLDTDTGNLTFGLIPPEAEPLDLRRYSPIVYGSAMYEYGESGMTFEAQAKGATGIAKTSELMLYFHPAGDTRAAEVGQAFAHPARCITAPAHLVASKALGPIGAPTETAQEALLCRLADFLIHEREVRGWYGLMHFGDLQMSYYREWDRWGFDHGGYAWLNTECLPDWGLWLMALRHGRTDWVNACIEMTRHNRDIDMYHRGNFRGCGTRHNVNHWGCRDKEWRVSMPLVKRLQYYLTGDPWTREVIMNTVDVYQSYDRTNGTAPSMSSSFTGVMVKYELTGDVEDLRVLRNMADVFARGVREDGHIVRSVHINIATGEGEPILDDQTMEGLYFFFYLFGAQQTMVEVAELLDDTPLKQAIQRHVDLCLSLLGEPPTSPHPPDLFGALPFAACTWRWTGMPCYREAVARVLAYTVPWAELEEIGGDGPLDVPRHLALNSTQRAKIVCSLGELMHLYSYALAAMPVPASVPQDETVNGTA